MNVYDNFIQTKKDNSKFISLEPGDSFKGIYKGALQKRNNYNADVLVYTFIDEKTGLRKEFDDGTIVIAKKFKSIPVETKVEIRCTASDKKSPTTGKPYRNYSFFVDGKEVLLPKDPTDEEIPVVDQDDEQILF